MRPTTRTRSVARLRAHASSAGPAPQRTAPARPGRPHRVARRAVRALTNLVLVLALLLFAGLAVGPHVLGYRTMTMLTGSMAPGINPGDVTVAVPEPIEELAAGQVISYHIPVADRRVVSHRVVALTRQPDGGVQVQTKGDHDAAPDPWTAVITDRQVWRVVAVVPHLGSVIQVLRAPGLRTVFLYLGPGMVALFLLRAIWRRGEAPTGEDDRGDARTALDAAVLGRLQEELEDSGCLQQFLTRWDELLQPRLDRIELALDTAQLSAAHEGTLSLQVTSAMIGLQEFAAACTDLEAALVAEDLAAASAGFTALRRLAPATARTLRDHRVAQPS